MKSTRSNGAPVVSNGGRRQIEAVVLVVLDREQARERGRGAKPASATALTSPRLPPDSSPVVSNGAVASRVIRLITPPIASEPYSADAAPFTTSTCSRRADRLAIEVDHAALDAAAAEQRLAVEQHQHLARIDALDLLAGRAGGFQPRREITPGTSRSNSADGLRAAFFDLAARQHRRHWC